MLAPATGQFERLTARVEQEPTTANRDRCLGRLTHPPHVATGKVGRYVVAVVEAPAERVEHCFPGLVTGKPGEDRSAHVGDPVSVGVLQVENVRHAADEHSTAPATDSPRRIDSIGKNPAAIEHSIAVGVFQQPDSPPALVLLVGVLVVFGHLADVQPAVLIELHRHRILHQGLGGHHLDSKPWPRHQRLDRLGRSGWWGARQIVPIVAIDAVLRFFGRRTGHGERNRFAGQQRHQQRPGNGQNQQSTQDSQ